MKEIKVISKTLNEEEFMAAIMEAHETPNISVLVEEGIEIPFSRKLEIQPMGWPGLLGIRAFDDLKGETNRIEIPEKPEKVYIFGENVIEIKVINKTLNTEEDFMAAIMEAYKTHNSTILIEAPKEIPFKNAQDLITTSTGWDGLVQVTLFKDEIQRTHVFENPNIPEVIYMFNFE